MTDSVPHPEQTAAPAAPDAAAPAAAAAVAPVATLAPGEGAAETANVPRPTGAARRSGRGGRGRKPAGAPATAPEGDAPAAAAATTAARRAPRAIPPALETLAQLYPQLFGAVFLPLKRGIFQDLLAAHPEAFEREALKLALGIHTRSTRYLQCVAAGQQRHDLQGQPVEAMAPEHVHQALLEVHRRRQGRSNEDLMPKLRARIVANIEASGLTREAYAERVRTRDEAANALLDEALAELAAKVAREEALLRTFEASGKKTVEEFADMYGMDPRAVLRSLHSARTRVAAAAAAAALPEAPAAQAPSLADAPAATPDAGPQVL
ncbi:MAG: ProQ/FINO family protein [Simplicispira sp.]|nr:ProQ/FINO family protein [Simplicispira sp.]